MEKITEILKGVSHLKYLSERDNWVRQHCANTIKLYDNDYLCSYTDNAIKFGVYCFIQTISIIYNNNVTPFQSIEL